MNRKLTLQRHIIAQQRNYPEATGEFTDLLLDLIIGIKSIANAVQRGGISQRRADSSRHTYSQEEMAEFAQKQIYNSLDHGGHLRLMSSRRISDPIPIPQKYPTGKYILVFDPFESAPNSGPGTPCGSIFSIFQGSEEDDSLPTEKALLQSGNQQVAAGYVLYGPSTILIYTSGTGVHCFILDDVTGEFILYQQNMQIPSSSRLFSFNASEMNGWAPKDQKFSQQLLEKESSNNEWTTVHSGSIIWDVHQILMRGGLYFKPVDTRDSHHPHGTLRLLHHCFPLSMICEQAGGKATDGQSEIQNLTPQDLHQRSPFFLGNKEMIEQYMHQEHETMETETP